MDIVKKILKAPEPDFDTPIFKGGLTLWQKAGLTPEEVDNLVEYLFHSEVESRIDYEPWEFADNREAFILDAAGCSAEEIRHFFENRELNKE